MKAQTAHCAACDKTVHIGATAVAPHGTHANVPDGGKLVCLEVGEECAGMMCSLSGTSTLLMGVRLARSGEVPDEDWPHARLACGGCGRIVDMEVLDGGHVFCTLCQSTNTVALLNKTDGSYVVVAAR